MLKIADQIFSSRLFLGTGKFGSLKVMAETMQVTATEMVTVALKRMQLNHETEGNILRHIPQSVAPQRGIQLLPNTSGARDAKEAVFAAQLAREAMQTNWLKLEIHPDPKYLMPDPVETLKATEILVKAGFIVLPYVHADPVLCKRLAQVGAAAVMPLAAPIGSNRGILTEEFLRIIIEQAQVPVVVDAGLGAPSHAARVMEMGADAVLVNTAIAVASDPVQMGLAFKWAVEAGRKAFELGLPQASQTAEESSPLTAFLQ